MSTQYRRSPDLYAFNNISKRLMVKSSVAFKRLFKQTPIFVDTRIKLLEELGPLQLPLPSTPEVPSPAVHVGEPLPPPMHNLLTVSETSDNAMRQQVRALIQAELKQNPNPYTAKSADEMTVLFRQMLVAMLLKLDENATKKPTPNVIKSTSNSVAAKKPIKRFGFRLAKPQISTDEDEGDEFSDEVDSKV